MVKNLPTNAGDMGLIPGLGRSHIPAHHNWRKPKCSDEDPEQAKINKSIQSKTKTCETIVTSKSFPCSSAGKKILLQGDPGSIPGSGIYPREGICYPFQYFWASLVSQMVKNLPAMWETSVQSLRWEDPPEKGMVTHSSIRAWRIPMDRGAWQAIVHGVAKSWTPLSD